MENKTLTITLTKSKYGRRPGHKQCLLGLGLRRLNQSVKVSDTPENRGMIDKVAYLLRVEE